MKFLRGCSFGIITGSPASRATLSALLCSLGGVVVARVGAHGVNLIATSDVTGVNLSALAEEFAQPILTEAWVRACVAAGAYLNPDDFCVTSDATSGPSLLADVNTLFGYASRRAVDSADAEIAASAAKRVRVADNAAVADDARRGVRAALASPDGSARARAKARARPYPYREWGGELSHSMAQSSSWLSPSTSAVGAAAVESSEYKMRGGQRQSSTPTPVVGPVQAAGAVVAAAPGVFSIYGSSSGSSRKDGAVPASTGTSARIDAIANAPILFSTQPPSAPLALAQSQWVFSTQLPITDADANTQAHGSALVRHIGCNGDYAVCSAACGGAAMVVPSSDSRSSFNVGGSPDELTTGAGAIVSRKRDLVSAAEMKDLPDSQQKLLDLWFRQRDAEPVSFTQIERDGRI